MTHRCCECGSDNCTCPSSPEEKEEYARKERYRFLDTIPIEEIESELNRRKAAKEVEEKKNYNVNMKKRKEAVEALIAVCTHSTTASFRSHHNKALSPHDPDDCKLCWIINNGKTIPVHSKEVK